MAINWNDPQSVKTAVAELPEWKRKVSIVRANCVARATGEAYTWPVDQDNIVVVACALHLTDADKPVDPLADIFADAFKSIHFPKGWAPMYNHILDEIAKRGGKILWENDDD